MKEIKMEPPVQTRNTVLQIQEKKVAQGDYYWEGIRKWRQMRMDTPPVSETWACDACKCSRLEWGQEEAGWGFGQAVDKFPRQVEWRMLVLAGESCPWRGFGLIWFLRWRSCSIHVC